MKTLLHSTAVLLFILLVVCACEDRGERTGYIQEITVRTVDGIPEFYNQASLTKFVPRGVNILNLTPSHAHGTFDVGFYDNERMSEYLLKLKSYGYNTVRLGLNGGPNGLDYNVRQFAGGDGFSQDYIINIYEFLKLLDYFDMYVIFFIDWLPSFPYGEIMATGYPDFDNENRFLLYEGGHEATALFWKNFATRMKYSEWRRHIMAYEIRNEFFYNHLEEPFDQIDDAYHRVVTTADGNTYDMLIEAERNAMMDNNMLLFINEVKAGINEVDDEVLVSGGLLIPWHKFANPSLIVGADVLDFIDLHIYPREHFLSMEEYATAFGLDQGLEVPVMIGEFGGTRSNYSRTARYWSGYRADGIFPKDYVAAADLVDWQIQMCDYNIQGWLNWSLEDDLFYSTIVNESLGDEVAERVIPGEEDGPKFSYTGYFLSPLVRPDPCSARTAFGPTLWND